MELTSEFGGYCTTQVMVALAHQDEGFDVRLGYADKLSVI